MPGNASSDEENRVRSQQRLIKEIHRLQQQWDRLSEKLTALEGQRILETRVEEKFRLKSSIDETRTTRDEIEHQLEVLQDWLAEANRDVKGKASQDDDQDSTERNSRMEKTNYSGKNKIELCRRLGESWPELADYFDIPDDTRRGFAKGKECREIWKWLKERNQLDELEEALQFINREAW